MSAARPIVIIDTSVFLADAASPRRPGAATQVLRILPAAAKIARAADSWNSRSDAGGSRVSDVFSADLMSRHAAREARRERIPLEMIKRTYEDPDTVRPSSDDELREIRTRWFAEQGIEVVVDVYDGRVVTVWRKGGKS